MGSLSGWSSEGASSTFTVPLFPGGFGPAQASWGTASPATTHLVHPCGHIEVMDRLGYVILFVGDLERSVAFYRDVIGVPFRLAGDGYVEFATQGAKFGLYDRSRLGELTGQGPEAPDHSGGEVVFLVGDVDAEAERLRAAGATILAGPVDRAWGHRTVHVLDPDGFVVELAEEIQRQPSPGRR